MVEVVVVAVVVDAVTVHRSITSGLYMCSESFTGMVVVVKEGMENAWSLSWSGGTNTAQRP